MLCTFQKTPFKEKKMERKHGAIAQWLERSPSKREVEGSIPSSALFFFTVLFLVHDSVLDSAILW